MIDYRAWGDSWDESWGDSWGIGLVEEVGIGLGPAKPPPVDFVIVAGGGMFHSAMSSWRSTNMEKLRASKREHAELREMISMYRNLRQAA